MTSPIEHAIKVKGMSCAHCVRAITKAIKERDAQATVEVDLSSGNVAVRSTLPREAVVNAIADEGYTVLA